MNRWGRAEVTHDHSLASAGPVAAALAGRCLDPANPVGHPGPAVLCHSPQPLGVTSAYRGFLSFRKSCW